MERLEAWWTSRLDPGLTCSRDLGQGYGYCLLRAGHDGLCLDAGDFLDGEDGDWSPQARTLIVEAYGQGWEDPGLGPTPGDNR